MASNPRSRRPSSAQQFAAFLYGNLWCFKVDNGPSYRISPDAGASGLFGIYVKCDDGELLALRGETEPDLLRFKADDREVFGLGPGKLVLAEQPPLLRPQNTSKHCATLLPLQKAA